MQITITNFGQIDKQPVDLINLKNTSGLKVSITNYGCIVTSLEVPDRNGTVADVVLGYESLEKYLNGHPFFGAIAGRCANRIKDGQFSLDGQQYQLETNEPPTKQHLHGGSKGFDKYVWGYDIEQSEQAIMIHFHRVSVDGESGYPGNLNVVHTIGLDNQNQLHYNFSATTDKPTIVNLVNHSYYNLAGHDAGPITHHKLTLMANYYTPVAENMIPTGEILTVHNTPLDFSQSTTIGHNMDKIEQGAIDHNFVLNKHHIEGDYTVAAELFEPNSGRVMTILTTQPAIQFYNGFKLSNKVWIARNGYQYQSFAGLCLETQHFPDSPNNAHFPSIRLDPNHVFKQKTIHRFSCR